MDTNNQTGNDRIREDQPTSINPAESGKEHPAKNLKSQEKIDIKESELGREQGQTPADEHIENRISQIDGGTVKMQENLSKESGDDKKQNENSEEDSGFANEINDTDVRDQNDSTTDWDAENSRTGRQK